MVTVCLFQTETDTFFQNDKNYRQCQSCVKTYIFVKLQISWQTRDSLTLAENLLSKTSDLIRRSSLSFFILNIFAISSNILD